MATTVGQHSVAAFTSPVNGTTPIDANSVRGNDNTVRSAYVDHDADPGIHVQSSTLASRPAAGTAGRKWITEDSGVYTLWFDDGTNWHPVSSENVALTVLAGENLVKGDVVKVTGWNNGQDLPEVVKVSSASDVAFAIMTAAVSSGSMGYATNTGIVQDVNTNSFAVGTILYPNTSGGFTSTKPTSGNYQTVAFVLRQNANNGVIFVEFSSPRIVERSDNTASTIVLRDASGNFSAGTITAGALTSTGLVTFASLKGTGATTVTNILDEDNMASDSATALATQQSIKAYVDAQVATVDTLAEVLANGNTTGANDIIVNAGQKIRTPLIASQNNATAITIADTTGALTFASALADSNLATISTAGKVSNSATTATSANTASAIVARDASGNFSAGTITAALTGNASTATALQTARTINGTSFDGTANITVTAAAGTLTGTTLASNVVSSSLTSVGTLANLTVTNPISGSVTGSSGSTTGNAATATALQTARNINGVSFNGTADITVTAAAGTLTGSTLASGVTASSLTSVGTLTSLTVSGTTSLQSQTTMSRQAGAAVNLLFGLRSSVADIATDTAGTIRFLNAAQAAVNMSIADAGDVVIRNNLTVDTNTLYVDAANNRVGVGTASPASTLTVSGDVHILSTNYLNFTNTAQQTYIRAPATSTIAFGTNSTEVMRLDASGNLGLGVTPSAWQIGKAIEVNALGSAVWSAGQSDLRLLTNVYYASSNYKYAIAGKKAAALFIQDDASFTFLQAGTGTNAGDNISFSTAMKLDASGNLGVGVSPSVRLHVKSVGEVLRLETTGATGNNYLNFTDASGDKAYVGFTASGNENFVVQNRENGIILFATNDTERARITSGGYFKASPTGTYRDATGNYHDFVQTANNLSVATFKNTAANGTQYGLYVDLANDQNDATRYFLSGEGAGVERVTLRSNGGIANYSANNVNLASDERLKKDIAPLTSTWDKLKAIEVVNFRYKDCNEGDPALYGVIAQQVQPIVPELVVVTREAVEAKDAVLDEDGNEVEPAVEAKPEYYGIREQPMYWLAIKALQEAQARIEALEARLEALEA